MFEANRRIILQSIAVGAGTLAASQSFALGSDGHAAGYDVSVAAEYLKTIPRKSGAPVVFTNVVTWPCAPMLAIPRP